MEESFYAHQHMTSKKQFSSKKISRQTLLYVLAGVLGIAMIGTMVWLSSFLVSNVNQALSPNAQAVEHVSFDIEGFEKLHLLGR